MDVPVKSPTLMSGADYRESLRRLKPVVYVDGRRVESTVQLQLGAYAEPKPTVSRR